MNPFQIAQMGLPVVGGILGRLGASQRAREEYGAARPALQRRENDQATRRALGVAVAQSYLPEGVFPQGALKELMTPTTLPKRAPGVNFMELLGGGLSDAGTMLNGARGSGGVDLELLERILGGGGGLGGPMGAGTGTGVAGSFGGEPGQISLAPGPGYEDLLRGPRNS